MKVAWITHRRIYDYPGGAEMTDRRLIELAPKDVTCEVFPRPPVNLDIFDRVVVTGTEGFSAVDMKYLADFEPIVYSHSIQSKGEDRKHLFESACVFIALNPMHLAEELKWLNIPEEKTLCLPSAMDVSGLHASEKTDYVLWAHRNVYHKGLSKAVAWAKRREIPIRVMYDVSREDVISAMAEAKWFILLSNIFDAGPRAVIEAQLSGCELIVDNVGYWECEVDALREIVERAPELFWEVVTT